MQKPEELGLMKLLKDTSNAQFVIPVYQRKYVWTNKEINRFFRDLNSVIDGTYEKCFLGVMIYLITGFSKFQYSVIDGQQRLITLFLTLYALKETMESQSTVDKTKMKEKFSEFLFTKEDNNGKSEYKYKLKPKVSDDDVYVEIAEGRFKDIKDTKVKESNMYICYSKICEHINKLAGKYTIDQILESLDKLRVVCIPIEKNDNPQKIFETINSTGVNLSASDLVRNFLLMSMEDSVQEDYYKNYWMKLENMFSGKTDDMVKFFRLYLAIKNYDLPSKNRVYDCFVEWYNDNNEGYGGVDGVFADILKYADCYCTIYKKNISDVDSRIKDAVIKYRNISSEAASPLLMRLLALAEVTEESGTGKTFLHNQLSDIINLTRTYLMRRALCGRDEGSLTRSFVSWLKRILDECSMGYDNIVEVYKRVLVNDNIGTSFAMPEDDELSDLLNTADMYTNSKKTLETFFKDIEMENNNAPVVDFSELSIEHLMPQTAGDWLARLGIDDDKHRRNVNRLGNLTFASKKDNSKMGNGDWVSKKKVLEGSSHLKINMGILEKNEWTIADIEDRTKFLINKAEEIYKYFRAEGADDRGIHIRLKDDKRASATGIFYKRDGRVLIDEGSELYIGKGKELNYLEICEEREKLKDDGIIGEDGGKLVFLKQYSMNPQKAGTTALSHAAEIILFGSRNGKDEWLYEDTDKTIKEVIYDKSHKKTD